MCGASRTRGLTASAVVLPLVAVAVAVAVAVVSHGSRKDSVGICPQVCAFWKVRVPKRGGEPPSGAQQQQHTRTHMNTYTDATLSSHMCVCVCLYVSVCVCVCVCGLSANSFSSVCWIEERVTNVRCGVGSVCPQHMHAHTYVGNNAHKRMCVCVDSRAMGEGTA